MPIDDNNNGGSGSWARSLANRLARMPLLDDCTTTQSSSRSVTGRRIQVNVNLNLSPGTMIVSLDVLNLLESESFLGKDWRVRGPNNG